MTIVDALFCTPSEDRLRLTFLVDGTPESAVTWDRADLVAEVDRYATALLDRGVRPGDRVVVAISPGLEFVAATYATMLISAAVVTAFPPRREKDVARFTAIVRDCDAGVVLTDDATVPLFTRSAEATTLLCPGDVARTATVDAAVRDTLPSSSTTALIQYTSGSTGRPRGVVVTHGNLVSNTGTVRRYFGTDAPHSIFTWLPPYHDMGLIGSLVYPIYSGYPVVAMAPLHFVQDPLRWLRGMSHHGSDITMGPNFALDLCARAVADGEPTTGIELTHLRSLVCGSEPVLESTVRRFVVTFAGHGLDPDAVLPAYGLAEATLVVSGKAHGTPYRAVPTPPAAGEHEGPGTSTVTGCGHAAAGHEIAVVDPDTRRRVGPGAIGEIWVSGPNVALGYFGRPDQSAATFAATLEPPDDRTYLRTGDLGFLDDELFVLGRLDDLIVISGRNVYPQDLEAAITQAHPSITKVAVVGVQDEGVPRLGVLAETAAPEIPSGDVDALDLAVRETVVGQFGINPLVIRIGGRLTVPTTTSGKPRRAEVRRIVAAARDGDTV